jgi:hypothetical protein
MLLTVILLAGLQVHEWGVIQRTPVLTGTPSSDIPVIEMPEYEFEEKAPVMYFHGDPCTVSIQLTFPNMGYATEVIPDADEGGVNSTHIVWKNIKLTDQRAISADFGWPVCEQSSIPAPVWREVNALDVVCGGYRDSFLYYECVPGSPFDLPFISESGNQSIRMPYGEIPCIALTTSGGRPMYGVFTLADILTSIPKGLQFLDEPEVLRREFLRWSTGILNEDEFNAFWNTWESTFLADCTDNVMILYPVPAEVLEQIAAIEIIPDREIDVQISRYIIAELPYRTP